MKKEIINLYKRKDVVETFDKDRSKYAFEKYKNSVEAKFLQKNLQKIPGNPKILDVGCGTGRMLPPIFNLNKKIKYFGVDTSKEMITQLKKKEVFKKNKKLISLKIADATKIPFKNDSFDLVFTYHVLWHLPKDIQIKILKEMIRVTKKGGYILFDFLNKNFLWERVKWLFGHKKTKGIYKLNLFEIRKIIDKKEIKKEKLFDIHIRNDSQYKYWNTFNKLKRILPLSFFHMSYLVFKK